ncbi:lipase [Metarhizium rileyi]|uniref:Lipase n=1 Tax=Metarhizium rileyi (strain RCEF 4871) TaxID=1649241 RepID=A0A162JR15_METRR|nr:lipase [Metarhizium rileyi RCEF 4871]
MRFSITGLSVLLSLVATSSAETASEEMLRNIDTFARYAAFGYCDHLVDGRNINTGTKVCSGGGIPGGCGDLQDAVVVMEFPSSEGAAGYVALSNKTQQIVVSFRGSKPGRDFLSDVNTCKTRTPKFLNFMQGAVDWVARGMQDNMDKISRPIISNVVKAACSVLGGAVIDTSDPLFPICPDCQLHSGFYEAFKGLKDKMLETVKEQKAAHPDFEVVVTGYSLGAALATLGAAYLRKAGFVADMYTYGSPRVGDAKFAEFVSNQRKGKNFRITNANDPVANIPWQDAGFGHVSPEYWFPQGLAAKEMQVCSGTDNLQCSGSFPFNLHDVAGGKARMKPHVWTEYAIGFPFTGPSACPGRSGRKGNPEDSRPFSEEEVAAMRRLASEGAEE